MPNRTLCCSVRLDQSSSMRRPTGYGDPVRKKKCRARARIWLESCIWGASRSGRGDWELIELKTVRQHCDHGLAHGPSAGASQAKFVTVARARSRNHPSASDTCNALNVRLAADSNGDGAELHPRGACAFGFRSGARWQRRRSTPRICVSSLSAFLSAVQHFRHVQRSRRHGENHIGGPNSL